MAKIKYVVTRNIINGDITLCKIHGDHYLEAGTYVKLEFDGNTSIAECLSSNYDLDESRETEMSIKISGKNAYVPEVIGKYSLYSWLEDDE